VDQALSDLGMAGDETRSTELGRLRERIERNLSGLMGPLLARMIVDQRLGTDPNAEIALASNVRFIEQQLEASNTRLRGLALELDTLRRYHRQILQDLPLGVCSVGPDREVVIWNMAMEILSGIPRNQALGTPLQKLTAPWGALLDGFLHTRDRHVHKQRAQIDGRPRWFNLHQSSIEDPVGIGERGIGRGGTVLLVEDLTDLHKLEAELTHSERLASIGRLAAGVAHEIGNPVTAIACLTQNLRDESDGDLLRESIDQVLQQTRRISTIVESLVSYSHSGTLEDHRPADLRLYDCIEDAMRLLRLSEEGKSVALSNHCDPELMVRGDRQRLAQVFVNLLTNACHASAPGDPIDVLAQVGTGMVTVEVLDRGSGIPEEFVSQVFEPFFTTKPAGTGTGLGLPLSYNIIHEHGGEIRLEARAGGGVRALIRLPYVGPGATTLQSVANRS